VRAALFIDGIGATRENDALGSELELGELLGAWQHLREDVELAQAASDASEAVMVSDESFQNA
jgi:hypothetical protein